MAVRFLVTALLVATLARARIDLSPEAFLQQYQASEQPLQCYQKNSTSGAVALLPCIDTNSNSAFRANSFPACMMIKIRGRVEQTCMIMPLLSAVDCHSSACFENVRSRFSECCCMGDRCNDEMVRRPQPVVHLPDEEWTPISPMKYARDSGETALLNGQIYVIGGFNGYKICDEVERYDPATDTWTTLKSMRTGRFYLGLYISCGKIFVYGGVGDLEEYERVTSVEMYDPDTDTWEEREPWRMVSRDNLCISFPVPASYPSPVPNLESIWISGFGQYGLKDELFRAIFELGVMNPTEAQSACLPAAVLGHDLICQARAGAGKTALLTITTLHHLEPVDGEVSVLVLCPTRQQTETIKEEFERFSKYLPPVKVAAFVGGVPLSRDANVIKCCRPHVVIGTPSRIVNLVRAGALKVDKIRHILLDDCDRMICDRDMRNAIEKICDSSPREKQMLISAVTFPDELRSLRDSRLRNEPLRFEYISNVK